MAAGSPGRTFSVMRALGALAAVVLLFAGIALFGFVITDFLDDESSDSNGGDTETEGAADNPSSVFPSDDGDEGTEADTNRSNRTG